MPAKTYDVFLYGSLLDLDLLEIVLRRRPEVAPAVLPGCRTAWVDGQDFPMIYESDGGTAEGLFLPDLSAEDVARMDFYEGPFAYRLRDMQVRVGDGERAALTYFPDAGLYQPGADWDVRDWSARIGPVRKIAAVEIMDHFGTMSAEEVARRVPVILARAQQKLNARSHSSPIGLRVKNDAKAVEVKSKTVDHDNWFLMEEYDLVHPKYDGSQSREIKRAVFVMADAVTVLPYDPVRDVVMLIEQFRAGIWRRGDPHPWSLEAIAGRIDAGETAEQTAHREAREETGLALCDLHRVGSYYASPGATTEYMTSFVAIADLPDAVAGVGGLPSEDEDIRAMIVPFQGMMDAVHSGEIENAPLMTSALWLALNRDRLRGSG